MDEVHRASLEILKKFDVFCRSYGLRYYISYGTLLGAVRHKSFIPWDDDMDVMMFREDFDRLNAIPKSEYPDGLEMIMPASDGYFCGFVPMIKDNNYVGKMTKGSDSCKGSDIGRLGIDVFVLEPSLRGFRKKIQMVRQYLLYSEARAHRFSDKPLDVSKYGLMKRLVAVPIVKLFQCIGKRKRLETIMCQYDKLTRNLRTDGSAVYAPGVSPDGFGELYELSWFDETVYVQIDGVEFPAPKEYLQFLEVVFGKNYMELPPEECRYPEHFVLKDYEDQ